MSPEVAIEDQFVMPVYGKEKRPVGQMAASDLIGVITDHHIAGGQATKFVQDGLRWNLGEQAVTISISGVSNTGPISRANPMT
jgi:hypothetical protein